jgi:hypothetical protein
MNISELITNFLRNLFKSKKTTIEAIEQTSLNELPDIDVKLWQSQLSNQEPLIISLSQLNDTYSGNVDILRPLIEQIKSVGFPPVILIINKTEKHGIITYSPIPEQAFLIQAAKMAYLNQDKPILLTCVEFDSSLGKVFDVYTKVRNQVNRQKYFRELSDKIKKAEKFNTELIKFRNLMENSEIE